MAAAVTRAGPWDYPNGLSVGVLLRPGFACLLRHLGEIETLSRPARAPRS